MRESLLLSGKSFFKLGISFLLVFVCAVGDAQNFRRSWALMNTDGERLYEQSFRSIQLIPGEGDILPLMAVSDGRGMNFINTEGKLLLDSVYRAVGTSWGNYIQVLGDKNKWGIIDRSGREMVPCLYDLCTWFGDGLGLFKKGSCWGVVGVNNRQVVPFEYDEIRLFSHLIAVRNGEYWGFYNREGELLTDLVYTRVPEEETARKGIIAVKADRDVYISAQGEEVVESKGDIKDIDGLLATEFHPGFYAVDSVGCRYFNYRGEPVTDLLPYDFTYTPFSEGWAVIGSYYSGFHFMDTTGHFLFDWPYNSCSPFRNGLSLVSVRGAPREYEYGVVDTTGEWVFPMNYQPKHVLPDVQLVIVGEPGEEWEEEGEAMWSLWTFTGEQLTGFEYEDIRDISHPFLLECQQNGKSGLLNKDGRLVLACEYDAVIPLEGDVLVGVEKNGKAGFFNAETGVLTTPLVYDYIARGWSGYHEVQRAGVWGIVAPDGREVLPCLYDMGIPVVAGGFIVGRNEDGLYAIVDSEGNIKWPYQERVIRAFYGNLIFVSE